METDKTIKERHSVRSFKKNAKIDYKKIVDIAEAGRLAPHAGSSPGTKFILVSDKEKIKELTAAAQQNFIEDVNWIIVVCSDKQFISKAFLDRTDKYLRQQAGAAIENMLLRATDLGLASCWIGAFTDEIVKRVLRIPASIEVEAMLPIGIELGKAKIKGKPLLDSLLFFNEWNNKYLDARKTMIPGSKT